MLQPGGSEEVPFPFPRRSIQTANMGLGPRNLLWHDFWGPNSILAVLTGPVGLLNTNLKALEQVWPARKLAEESSHAEFVREQTLLELQSILRTVEPHGKDIHIGFCVRGSIGASPKTPVSPLEILGVALV